ncbi:hypothetical protein SAMN04487969_10650 [Paenibacillus algorifonticola]|uniref:Uncharacterized protein n=1 Tax=Paenibacillus algorifonticola TaxID=684063 RepID=A0A1I2D3C9_9BACL|nr:hypothetical protein [Paenibacillus algorifonticola]SFE74480.1 hypothetical protein SAMN04487969_10650 [Paenibacillus algorifonticola]
MPTQSIHVAAEVGTIEDSFEQLAKLQKTVKYLVNGNLDFENIRARGIKADNIEAGSITANEIAAGTITSDQIAAGTITSDNIAAGSITVDKIKITELLAAVEAEIDFVVSNVTITNVLAADKGYIAELTVDQLETSDKVQKYLNSDTSDVNYIRIRGQTAEWVTASRSGSSIEQARDRYGNLLYWTNSAKTAVTAQPTSWGVMQYVYNELVKSAISFQLKDGQYLPEFQLGSGNGNGNRGKSFIRKLTDGIAIQYYRESNGELVELKVGESGVGFGIDVRTSDPTSPAVGQMWFRSDL